MLSAYIVQTQVISLSSRPLTLSGIRPQFRGIFGSKDCFNDMKELFYVGGRLTSYYDWQNEPGPNAAFIKNLSSIFLNLDRIIMTLVYDYSCVEPNDEYWIESEQIRKYGWRKADGQVLNNFIRHGLDFNEIFGYDPMLEDQRMNHLYFETRNPLYIRAVKNGKTQADGRIFVHLYPSGYVVLHLAIALKPPNFENVAKLRQSLAEFTPRSSTSGWEWTCKLGSGDLSQIYRLVKDNILLSLFEDRPRSLYESKWYYAVKLVTDEAPEIYADGLFKGDYEKLKLGVHPSGRQPHRCRGFNWDNDDDEEPVPIEENLVVSRSGLICTFSPSRMRNWARFNFWKILTVYEFVLLKNQIYEDYANFLRPEIANLKEFRLSTKRKLTQEDLFKFSVYDPSISRYLLTLDQHTKTLADYYSWIYAALSANTGFSDRREKVKSIVKEWEEEVGHWEPAIATLWKKIIYPLRVLLLKN